VESRRHQRGGAWARQSKRSPSGADEIHPRYLGFPASTRKPRRISGDSLVSVLFRKYVGGWVRRARGGLPTRVRRTRIPLRAGQANNGDCLEARPKPGWACETCIHHGPSRGTPDLILRVCAVNIAETGGNVFESEYHHIGEKLAKRSVCPRSIALRFSFEPIYPVSSSGISQVRFTSPPKRPEPFSLCRIRNSKAKSNRF
jgi:hypothetical protein